LVPRAFMLRRGFGPSRLDAETRVWPLASWPILALRLELGILLFNGLSFSDFQIAYRTPSKVSDIPRLTGTDFEILWTLAQLTLMTGLSMLRV